jgi:hypothetical protein
MHKLFKARPLRLWRVFNEQSPPGYFQVAYVLARTQFVAIELVREAAGGPFVNADGTFGPLYPDRFQANLQAQEVEQTGSPRLLIGWTVPE